MDGHVHRPPPGDRDGGEARVMDELFVFGRTEYTDPLTERGVAASGEDALTGSELRVARMAADGMTNREIAEGLFVSLRTVETHLTHAYRKLSIDSRDELAGVLEPSRPAPVRR